MPDHHQSTTSTPRLRAARVTLTLALCGALVSLALAAAPTLAAVRPQAQATAAAQPPAGRGTSLESAASKAGDTGRKVAMSLIALAFAIAAIVLAFKRDFKEAGGVFAVGVVAVLLATPAGLNLLRDTVTSLFGA